MEVCENKFAQKCTLKSHMLIHTNEKPHEFEVCYKQFTLKSNVDRKWYASSFGRNTDIPTHHKELSE